MQARHQIIVIVSIIVTAIFLPTTCILAQNKTILDKVDQYLQSKFLTSNVPGFAVAIVDQHKITFSKGYGKTGSEKKITGNTPFAIASLSKAFTAFAVMQLADSGKLNLDSAIGKYLDFSSPEIRRITVRQFLNQTSGFSDKVFPELQFRIQPANLETAIARLNSVKPATTPGTRFSYHNPNYHVLARLVEVLSGESFPGYLQKHILGPLQMTSTFSVANTKNFYANNKLSKGHTYLFGVPLKTKEFDWFVEGSAGMVSSVNDMARWLMLHLNNGNYNGNQLLSSAGIKSMQTPPDNNSGYGMGWVNDGNGNISHTGILWTYQSHQLLMTKKGYGLVILFNGGLNIFKDYDSFMQGIAAILNNDPPTSTESPLVAFEVLVGAFLVLSLFYCIRRLTRLKAWQEKNYKTHSFKLYAKLLCRLFPMALLLIIPQIIIAMSGRVLSWERIFWFMPDIIIWLGTVAILNLAIVLFRLKALYFDKSGN